MSEQFQFPEVGFSKSFRGYHVDEVESYVDELRREFGHLVDKINGLEKEISRMRELEGSLLRAMQLAEEAQKTWQEKVEAEAKSIDFASASTFSCQVFCASSANCIARNKEPSNSRIRDISFSKPLILSTKWPNSRRNSST